MTLPIVWSRYETSWDAYQQNLYPMSFPKGLDRQGLYRLISSALRDTPEEMTQKDIPIEANWYETGQPEYRIHPSCIDALGRTSLDIPNEHVHLPFSTMMFVFPKGHLKDNHPNAPPLTGMLAYEAETPWTRSAAGGPVRMDKPRRVLCIVYKFERDARMTDEQPAQLHTFQMSLPDGGTLEQSFHRARGNYDYVEAGMLEHGRETKPSEEPWFDKSGYWPGHNFIGKLLKIMLATAAFATGLDKKTKGDVRMVEEVKLPRRERRRAARGEDEARRVFDVGRVLDLPRDSFATLPHTPQGGDVCVRAGCQHTYSTHSMRRAGGACNESECTCPEFDTGRHLAHAHLRSGHVRWIRKGPREGPNDYVLGWVAPTVVRPDLPFREDYQHTPYQVREKEQL